MKKTLFTLSIAIALFACSRKKELADTEGATIFGAKSVVTPQLAAPCTMGTNRYLYKGDTTMYRNITGSGSSGNYSIYGDDLWNNMSLTLSEKPTKFPDTLRFDGKVKNSIYIKSFSFMESGVYTFTPEYSKITSPIYLYINKDGKYTTYEVCGLPLYSTASWGTTRNTFSTKISIKD